MTFLTNSKTLLPQEHGRMFCLISDWHGKHFQLAGVVINRPETNKTIIYIQNGSWKFDQAVSGVERVGGSGWASLDDNEGVTRIRGTEGSRLWYGGAAIGSLQHRLCVGVAKALPPPPPWLSDAPLPFPPPKHHDLFTFTWLPLLWPASKVPSNLIKSHHIFVPPSHLYCSGLGELHSICVSILPPKPYPTLVNVFMKGDLTEFIDFSLNRFVQFQVEWSSLTFYGEFLTLWGSILEYLFLDDIEPISHQLWHSLMIINQLQDWSCVW